MADCKKCIHSNICIFTEETPDCIQFQDRADVVEVVRCKDCKHYCLSDFRKPNEPKWCEMFYDGYFYPKPNDFCFYGERREE